jgi:adenylate kinase family enzyme
VLDGFPRTVPQAEALDAVLAGRGPIVVIELAVPADVLVRRLSSRRICGTCGTNAPLDTGGSARCPSCGGPLVQRPDDAEDVVRKRLAVKTADQPSSSSRRGPRSTSSTATGRRTSRRGAGGLVGVARAGAAGPG